MVRKLVWYDRNPLATFPSTSNVLSLTGRYDSANLNPSGSSFHGEPISSSLLLRVFSDACSASAGRWNWLATSRRSSDETMTSMSVPPRCLVQGSQLRRLDPLYGAQLTTTCPAA